MVISGMGIEVKEIESPASARCVACGGFAPFFCDYEVLPGKTCDAPLCGKCRYNLGVRDFCPEHAGRHD